MTTNNTDVVTITPADLPLHCPTAIAGIWNQHPLVYLPIESNSSISCPYCGTTYHLDGEVPHHSAI